MQSNLFHLTLRPKPRLNQNRLSVEVNIFWKPCLNGGQKPQEAKILLNSEAYLGGRGQREYFASGAGILGAPHS